MSTNERQANLPERLVDTLRTFSMTAELIYNTGQMRHYQKKFFKERKDPDLKKEYLEESKKYEGIVDDLLKKLSEAGKNVGQQSNLFSR
jgi:hypothetical protein